MQSEPLQRTSPSTPSAPLVFYIARGSANDTTASARGETSTSAMHRELAPPRRALEESRVRVRLAIAHRHCVDWHKLTGKRRGAATSPV